MNSKIIRLGRSLRSRSLSFKSSAIGKDEAAQNYAQCIAEWAVGDVAPELDIKNDTNLAPASGCASTGSECSIPCEAADAVTGVQRYFNVKQKQFNVVYGNSLETSDFIVDGLAYWWRYNKQRYSHITSLQIDLDNGPELESHRTQFIKRIVDWSDFIQLPIELVYYPPYHSKYNSVEHCWGVLENHWNGALLTDINIVRDWIKTMRWDGKAPNVYVLDRKYSRGVKLTVREMKSYSQRVCRTPMIERWSLFIQPKQT